MPKHSHQYGRLHDVQFDRWDAFVKAAVRAERKASDKTRADLVAQRIRIKQFHKIRAGQKAALDHRLRQLEKEFFPK